MISYSEKLKDPRWQKVRLQVLNRDEFTCQHCGDTETTLHVHHLSYSSEPWETENHLLTTLCEVCHKDETNSLKLQEKQLIKCLKLRGFDSNHFGGLNSLMDKMPIVHVTEVQLSALEWYLDESNLIEIVARYFDYLKDKSNGKS